MLIFEFLEKVLGIVSPPHFVYDFFRKMFLTLYSINWPNVGLPYYLLRYWAKCLLQLFVNHVVALCILKLILSF